MLSGKTSRFGTTKKKPVIGHDTKPVLSIPALIIYPLLGCILLVIFINF